MNSKTIRVAIVGLGNCAGNLVEGIQFYRQNSGTHEGLLFPALAGYAVSDIEVVAAFDISADKVGLTIGDAIYQTPNTFVQIEGVHVENSALVYRGPTLDGNPEHLARFVEDAAEAPVDVVAVLKQQAVEIVINLLPTGSTEAAEFYANAALDAGCAFINCIPTVIAQRADMQAAFKRKGLPLLGDDIKGQMGTTILHQSLLHLLQSRGVTVSKTSQLNLGGNTDFANIVHRAEGKAASKQKPLSQYLPESAESHVGFHYDPTLGPLKNAFIEIEGIVWAGSPVKISVKLECDDKPNNSGAVADLVRIAKGALDRQMAGFIPEACALYFKMPPEPMEEADALTAMRTNWLLPVP
jgi:myo-inositol-1-phosphate synthase